MNERRSFGQLLILVLLTQVFSLLQLSAGSNDEALALVALKATITDPQNHLGDWKVVDASTNDPCLWTGVTCGNSSSSSSSLSMVVSLNLSSMNLTGTLSPELGRLKNLVTISVDCNNFTGPVPAEITTLSQLQYVNISNNNFSDGLPANFSQLQLLQVCICAGFILTFIIYFHFYFFVIAESALIIFRSIHFWGTGCFYIYSGSHAMAKMKPHVEFIHNNTICRFWIASTTICQGHCRLTCGGFPPSST